MIQTNGDYIDFLAPIAMTESQLEKFVKFMKKTFPREVKTVDVIERDKVFGPIEREYIDWTVDDYLLILRPATNEELVNKMGRTDMSIIMKRGEFVPKFLVWAKKKGYLVPATKKMVRDFLDESGLRYSE